MRLLALLLAISISAHAGVKTAGVGHFQIPTAPAAGTSVTSGAANTYTTNAVQLIASTAAALYITGIYAEEAAVSSATYKSVQLMIGAGGAETVLGQYLISPSTGSTVTRTYRPIYPPIPVANAQRISVKTADSAGALATLISLEVIAQTNVVDDAIPVTTVTTVTNQLTAAQVATGVWQDATAGDFTTASSIGKTLYIANVAPGGSGGLMISGTNAGTTTLGALTVTGATTHTGATVHTGNVSYADGITVAAPSTGNRAGLDIAGNGTGSGLKLTGGATGNGVSLIGGATSGDGLNATVTSGHGFNITATGTAKNALNLTGAAASGANAAGSGILSTGGAASTSGGGTSGTGATITGGAGAASTNGAAVGMIAQAGGTTTVSGNDGVQFTGTGNGDGFQAAAAGSGKDFQATTTPLTLAKTTNLTGLNDIAATAIVSGGAITTSAGAVSTVTTVTNQLTAAQVATGVWTDTTAGDFTTALSVGKSVMNGVTLGTGLTVASVSGAVGSVTGLTASNLDATISSRMATYTQPTGFLAATFPSGTIANTTNLTAGTVATVTNRVTANTDQLAGQTVTAAAGVTFPTSVASPTNITAGTITTTTNVTNRVSANVDQVDGAALTSHAAGKMPSDVLTVAGTTQTARDLGLNLDATVSSRLATAGYTAPDNTRPTNFTALAITAGGEVTVGTNNDKTGYALSAAYDAAKTAAQAGDVMKISSGTGANQLDLSSGTVNVGKISGTTQTAVDAGAQLDAAISTRAPAATALSTATWTSGRATNLDNLDATVSSRSTYAGADTSGTTTLLSRLTSGRATALDNLDAAVTSRMATFTLPTNFSAFAIDVGGAVTAGTVSDKIGYSLVSGYDPAKTAAQAATALSTAQWTNTRAGKLDFLDATVSTRLPTSSYTAPDNSGIVAIKAKTDSLTFSISGKVDANAKAVNSVVLTGAGTSLNPWGPAP